MSVRFAAARHAARSPVARVLTRPDIAHVANDEGEAGARETQLLHDTLRHFAVHGLGAFEAARERAVAARSTCDGPAYDHWLGICRTLDRRRTARLAPQPGHK